MKRFYLSMIAILLGVTVFAQEAKTNVKVGFIFLHDEQSTYDLNVMKGIDEVCAEMDAMHRLRFPGPTTMKVMRKYLDKYIVNYKACLGIEQAAVTCKK